MKKKDWPTVAVIIAVVGVVSFVTTMLKVGFQGENSFTLEKDGRGKTTPAIQISSQNGFYVSSPFVRVVTFRFWDSSKYFVVCSKSLAIDVEMTAKVRPARKEEARDEFIRQMKAKIENGQRPWPSELRFQELTAFDLDDVQTGVAQAKIEAFLARNNNEVPDPQTLSAIAKQALQELCDRYPFLSFGFTFSNFRIEGRFVRE